MPDFLRAAPGALALLLAAFGFAAGLVLDPVSGAPATAAWADDHDDDDDDDDNDDDDDDNDDDDDDGGDDDDGDDDDG